MLNVKTPNFYIRATTDLTEYMFFNMDVSFFIFMSITELYYILFVLIHLSGHFQYQRLKTHVFSIAPSKRPNKLNVVSDLGTISHLGVS